MKVEVLLTPAEIALLPGRDLSRSRCVVFDVLRATTTILAAFANGARRIFPVSTIEEALALRRDGVPGALLGGERGGLVIPGFDLGNSPREYARAAVGERDIITTTTNGTLALRACTGSSEVLAGAWVNLDALAVTLRHQRPPLEELILVCAGTGKHFALEDGLAAGALLDRLYPRESSAAFGDAAVAALTLYRQVAGDPLRAMRNTENGRRLLEIGLAADLEWCVHTTALNWIASLRDGALHGAYVGAGAA